ncbi:MAG: hypothetical protein KAK04_00870 [Cyclobacteriaceae bacterium]|nr:hypothetical protein [Cyclobacteriaceae bacterium]
MAKVVITAEVEDLVKWEEGFRTHGNLFRSQTNTKPISIATNDGNEVALIFEPEDLDTFMRLLDSEGPEAMANDGVIRETVKLFIMDKEFKL